MNRMAQAVEQLSSFFQKDPDVWALVLTGSLADPEMVVDEWSDLDLKLVLAEHALDRYFSSLEWLDPFGRILGVERHPKPYAKTLRVCLQNLHRFDFSFVPQSALANPAAWKVGLFRPPCTLIWSRLPELESKLAHLLPPAAFQEVSPEEIERMADTFWFKAAAAVAKLARNDLLIGLHLALDLARECLVLQMMRRDRELQTAVHREGGWGNELTGRFSLDWQGPSSENILELIRSACETFDELATDLSSSYQPRGMFLYSTINSAKDIT